MAGSSLIGREAEIAVLRGVADRVADRVPSAVLIEGEAGIGKTSLVRDLVTSQSSRGATVLVGACSPGAGRDLPFDVWNGVMRGLAPDAARLVDGSATAASRGQVLASVTDRLLGVARRSSTTVVLEDVHWADDSSLDLLDYLVRSARDERLLVAVTARSPDPAYDAVRQRLAELARLPQVTVVHPRRLSRDDVARQLEELTGSVPADDAVRSAAERSSGVPFLVEELVAAGAVTDDDPVAGALLAHRVVGLGADARAVVEAAAVGRDPLDDDLLFGAAGLPDDTFDTAVADAVSAGVLERAGGHGYRFRHALLREATLHELPPRRRRALHRGWAEAMAARPGGPATRAADLAEHWSEAGDDRRALGAYVRAAEEAALVFAHRERFRLLVAAVETWDRVPDAETTAGTDLGSLLADAVELAQLLSDHATGRELIDRGRRLFSRPDDRPRRAWFDVVDLWLRWGEEQPVPLSEVQEAVAAIRLQAPGRQQVRALFTLSNALLQDGRAEAALPIAEEASSAAVSVGDATVQSEALGHLAMVLAALGEFDRARACAAEKLARSEEVGDPLLVQGALTTQGVVQWEAGDVRGARLASERGRELLGGGRPGPLHTQWAVHTLNSAEGLLDEGLWDEAGRRLDEAAAAADQLTPWASGWQRRLGTWLEVVRGDIGADELDLGVSADHEHHRVQDAYVEVMTVVDVLVHVRRVDEARRAAATVLWEPRIEHAIPAYVWPLLTVTSRAEVEATQAGAAADTAVLDRLAALAAVVPASNPVLSAHAAQVRSDLAWSRGAPDRRLCREAAVAWEQVGLPYWHAWALLRLGRAAADADDDGEARDCLQRASAIAEELGAAPLAERVRATAAECGVRLRPRSGAGHDAAGLTPREREVLALLDEGESNRGIAERLVISEKTVSVHVSNLLAKLGVSSRGEAVAAARRRKVLGDGS